MNFFYLIKDISLKINNLLKKESLKILTHKNSNDYNQNASNDIQKNIDILAQNLIVDLIKNSDTNIGAIISEESHNPIILDKYKDYIIAIDPLDGSSNFEVNGQLGVIFSIFPKKSKSDVFVNSDFIYNISDLELSGYILFGSYISIVICNNQFVQHYILNSETNKYVLISNNLKIPNNPKYYCINESLDFDEKTRKFIEIIKKKNLSQRYSGCLVSDFHRILLEGGIFIYPQTKNKPKGKLRLSYELIPLSHIILNSGGKAINGNVDMIDVNPKSIHDTSPIFMGSSNLINLYNRI